MTEKTKPVNWKDLLDFIRRISLTDEAREPAKSGIGSIEIYNAILEMIDILRFHISRPHMRNPEVNPEFRIFREQIDEHGNTDTIIKVSYDRELEPVSVSEVEGLFFIQEEIIHLRRNRRISRQTKRALTLFGQSKIDPNAQEGFQSYPRKARRNRPKRRTFPWWYSRR